MRLRAEISNFEQNDEAIEEAVQLENELVGNRNNTQSAGRVRGAEFPDLDMSAFHREVDNIQPNGEYIRGLTNMEELNELRRQEQEFFNRDDIRREVCARLEEMCTDEAIDAEVRRVWALSKKTPKRVTPKERADAIQQIKQNNRTQVCLRVTQIREAAFLEKYGLVGYEAPDQNLFDIL